MQRRTLTWLGALVLLVPAVAMAYTNSPAAEGTATNSRAGHRRAAAGAGFEPALTAPADTNAPIDATADELNVDRAKGVLEGTGHVVISRGTEVLRAAYVRYDMNSGEARAVGNVTITRPGAEWTGDKVTYNFKTGEGEADKVRIDAKPFRVVDSRQATRAKDGVYHLKGGRITTCSNDYPECHYYLRARELDVKQGDYFVAHGATWFLGPVPILYLPYWYHNIDRAFIYTPTPGYDSRMGAFLLNSFSYSPSRNVRAKTRLDYRSRRGIGVGQDVRWLSGSPGDISLYYIDDRNPVEKDADSTAEIDSQRYRIRFRQDTRLSVRDNVLLRGQYVSDENMLRDFFEKEYRQESEPNNHITYTHRGNGYVAGLMARKRLNDFYRVVERLPEASLNVMRQEVADTTVFYEGRNSAGYLRKVYEKVDTGGDTNAPAAKEDYDAFRFDTRHMLYRPTRYWGFLNVIPRVGYEGTYYSKSLPPPATESLVLETNIVTRPDGSQDVVVREMPVTNSTTQADSVFRSRIEFGMEASFKAYKTWENVNGDFRHVVEPYGNYTITTDPTVAPEELYQFDNIDRLDKEHWVRLGVRNKIQEKRAEGATNLVAADVYTVVKLSPRKNEETIENIFYNVTVVPVDPLQLRVDGRWSLVNSRFEQFNARSIYSGMGLMNFALEYRHAAEKSDLLTADLNLLPNRPWTYNLYTRYEFTDQRLEEQGLWVQRNLDCLSLRLGLDYMPGFTRSDGSERKEEYRIVLAFWLTAFPEMQLGTRHAK